MTASRVCRSCGAELPGVVRWCLRCHEPVRELTPRERVWQEGTFVEQPIHRGGAVPHWSRWDKSATTLGPWGRISLTVVLVATLPAAGLFGMFMYVIWFPVILIVGLRGIWAKGWVVPGAPTSGTGVALPSSEGSRFDRAEIIHNVLLAATLLAGVATLLYVQSPVVRFIVIVTGVVAAAAACLRWVRGDR